MKRKILSIILATIFCTTIGTMRVEAKELEDLLPADFTVIEQEVETGITIQILKTVFTEGEYVKVPYYITSDGETFESISKSLGVSKEDLIRENADYRMRQDGTYAPFVEYVYVSIPEVAWSNVSGEVYYYISKGDTLSEIAKYFDTTITAIQELNPEIVDVNKIYADTVIKIK